MRTQYLVLNQINAGVCIDANRFTRTYGMYLESVIYYIER